MSILREPTCEVNQGRLFGKEEAHCLGQNKSILAGRKIHKGLFSILFNQLGKIKLLTLSEGEYGIYEIGREICI